MRPADIIDIALKISSWHYGYDITHQELVNASRKKERVAVRQVLMYIMRKRFGMTVSFIGTLFNRDHTTVTNACIVVENMVVTKEYNYCVLYEQIISKLDLIEDIEYTPVTATITFPEFSNPEALLEKIRLRFNIDGKLNVA